MSKEYGVLLVSHVEGLADGVATLVNEVAKEVSIKSAGGTSEGEVGTSFEKIEAALQSFEEETILAFYDLGSAKMNLELAIETSDKTVTLYDAAFVEGAYTASALLQAEAPLDAIEEQLKALVVK
ncbi:MAG: dihydroxyacetone kinase phosphoryl donor subunit DhaM [Carnobacterium sp.]|uniref:phosphoenolpyruvate--glycerone phosphotransferase n=1 Tax=Carnobacterium antarcticum TaxID=2126436 RepID=A0ABW4NJX8_9LACT|nr:dihydroxyacetone kinase phosphoryl donor subunit DhaM [Carnobacterium sp. CP1]ALV22416.1 Phosphoenolpyruvate-dihydroxyacetone phosphotransferase, subunit DhaM DHA-specific IIA component [Carnobacterium sp. CP1]